MSDSFNIFTVLSKDNKELTHSAFLKFILEEFPELFQQFFEIEIGQNPIIELEQLHRVRLPSQKKNSPFRFDLEILSDNQVVIIENKFKSFPMIEQLSDYSYAIKKEFGDNTHKILICFDKKVFPKDLNKYLNDDKCWKVYDYEQLLSYLNKLDLTHLCNDRKWFIQQYISFLQEYYWKYMKIKENPASVLLDQSEKENKFWVKLLYFELVVLLETYFSEQKIEVELVANTGNTNIPIIDIKPKHWIFDNEKLLIQIQDWNFKFYAHSENLDFLQKVGNFTKERINNEDVKFKKAPLKNAKSQYIFTLNLRKKINDETDLSVKHIFDLIIKFYKKIDSKVINEYRKQTM